MKLTELFLRNQYSLSFEVFPPKTSDAFSSVGKAAVSCARLHPAFVSVTYGAGGGRSKYTLELADQIQRETGIPVLAHLTCVSSTREDIQSQISEMRRLRIDNVMALRGDMPAEHSSQFKANWAYQHAIELVKELKDSDSGFCIGGACYPEVHPESPHQKEDITRLKEKVDAGCDFLTTQMFFDNNLFFNFLYKIREAGITVPVLPGIMPITTAKQVERAIQLSGSFMPQRFRSLVDRFGSSDEAMRQAGIAYATDQVIDLFANGIRNVHIYTMNKPDVAGGILSNVSSILGMGI